ncbi:MAG TPA: hypothetical protein VFN50_11170 [Acidimicrobiales bacterium]|nr:hypothetical protein [Acidimicrobiales bacterium]
MGAVGKLVYRRASLPSPGADLVNAEKLELVGVRLVGEVGETGFEVPRLGLRFDGNGILVRSADGEVVSHIAWVSLRRMRVTARRKKGAAERTELEIESDRQRHRFVVPNVDPNVLCISLRAISARHARSGLVEDGTKGLLRIR